MTLAAIILIDMNSSFLLEESPKEIELQKTVLQAFPHLPQIVLELDYLSNYNQFTTLSDLKLALSEKAIVLLKDKCDGFIGTEGWGRFARKSLEAQLRQLNVDNLIVMGYHRDVCVFETTRSAVNRGYQIHASLDLLCIDKIATSIIQVPSQESFYHQNPKIKLYPSTAQLIEGVRKLIKNDETVRVTIA